MNHQQPSLKFLGATDTVTGSRYLIDAGGRRLLVDCGLFQGYKRSRERNRAPFPVPPRSIDAVVLTHAHMDHTGCVAAYGPDPKNAIILSGYQAGGTRGATLAAGERQLRIYGEDIKVRAEVIQMESLSTHADADGIIAWMKAAAKEPRMTYITHGDPDASDALRSRIKRELGWRARVPEHLEAIDIEDPQ